MTKKLRLEKDEILVLRNCKADGTSYKGFQWPKSGYIKCPDWQDTDQCGNGFHGLPWGTGSVSHLYNEPNAVWVVFKASTVAGRYRHGSGDFTDKCKSADADVVYYGNKEGAISLLAAHLPDGLAMNFATQKAGDDSTQKAGDDSTQTAGDDSTQTAGWNSTQTAGDYSTQTAGDYSTQKAGWNSTQTAGWNSTQKAGDDSTQKAGDDSTQKAGWNSVQVCFWWDDGKWNSACRIVPENHVDQWCRVEKGIWRLCTEAECEEAERRVAR